MVIYNGNTSDVRYSTIFLTGWENLLISRFEEENFYKGI